MSESAPQSPVDEETLTSEITIAPDGRVFMFGASRPLMEILEGLNPRDPKVTAILATLKCELDPPP